MNNRKNKLSLMATLSLTLTTSSSLCSSFVHSPLTSTYTYTHRTSAINLHLNPPATTNRHHGHNPAFHNHHHHHNHHHRPFGTTTHRTMSTRSARGPLNTRTTSTSTTTRWNSFSDVLESLEQTLNPSKPTSASSSSSSSTPNNEEETMDPETNINIIPPYAAQTLDGRLLCVSQCAYEISPPYFRACGYRPGTTAKRVSRGVNSALIGTTVDGITIAFRGTLTTSLLDWLQNAALFLSDVDEDKFKIKGKIHTGFYRGTKSLWKPIKSILKEMIAECEEKGWKTDVHFTGHSKGGAMASIAAILMKADKELPDPSYICTFASARVGDSQFRDAYNQRLNQTSYEAHLDLIPFLPPSASTMDKMSDEMSEMIEGVLWSETSSSKKDKFIWDYQTLGQRKFINEDGDIIDDVTKELDAQRIRDIEMKSILSLDEFKQAHCSGCASEGCGGNYFSALADGICDVSVISCDDGDTDGEGDCDGDS